MTGDAGLASDSSETDAGLQAVLGTYVLLSISQRFIGRSRWYGRRMFDDMMV